MPSGNSSDAIDGTVPRSDPVKSGGLPSRILSAAVLVPPVVAALYYGSPYSDLLVLVGGAVLAWEWAGLCGAGQTGLSGMAVIAAVVAAIAAGILGAYDVAGWLLAAGAMAGAVVAVRLKSEVQPLWYSLGIAYIGVPCLAFLWLRQDPDQGRSLVLWLVVVVWATDIGAYAAGRTIGGPRLAPSISPNKTWAGLAGGIIAAACVGLGTSLLLGSEGWVGLMVASGLLALAAQGGDLFESAIKRHFGVKDTAHLIPGHGGLLDRVDGLLAATVIVAAKLWLERTPL